MKELQELYAAGLALRDAMDRVSRGGVQDAEERIVAAVSTLEASFLGNPVETLLAVAQVARQWNSGQIDGGRLGDVLDELLPLLELKGAEDAAE